MAIQQNILVPLEFLIERKPKTPLQDNFRRIIIFQTTTKFLNLILFMYDIYIYIYMPDVCRRVCKRKDLSDAFMFQAESRETIYTTSF